MERPTSASDTAARATSARAPSANVDTPARIRTHVKPPHTTPAQRKALREKVRAECANAPGVYRMLGPSGTVVYVGQSRALRTRLLSYFRAKGRRNKASKILRHAHAIEWEYTSTEFGALLRELRLIKQYRPHFNAMMVTDDWPRAYVSLTGGLVPGLRVVPRSDDPTAVAMFGPFRRVGQLRDAVRALAEATGVRDCALDFASEARRPRARTRVPDCLRYDVGTCPGPCIGAGDANHYRAQAAVVREFLEGRSDAPIVAVTHAMHEASAQMAFEHAAVLRDRLAHLTWLYQRVQHFHANMDRLTFRYVCTGPDGREWVYLIRRGTVRAEQLAPTCESEESALDQLAHRIFTGPDPTGADIPLHDLDEFYLVASWFRRRPHERARALRPSAR
ncbi:MAG: GIY-YIG nuclease family protein [Gemmatimonadaceae bacterium]|nr:GIY-YIG nuclease family protein [Gemmatimonadaceae bacterium]